MEKQFPRGFQLRLEESERSMSLESEVIEIGEVFVLLLSAFRRREIKVFYSRMSHLKTVSDKVASLFDRVPV